MKTFLRLRFLFSRIITHHNLTLFILNFKSIQTPFPLITFFRFVQRRCPLPSSLIVLRESQPWIELVSECITDRVKAQDQERNYRAWKQRHPRSRPHEIPSEIHH